MWSKRSRNVPAASKTAAPGTESGNEDQIWATYALSYDAVLPNLDF
jgi:hypothetical protein